MLFRQNTDTGTFHGVSAKSVMYKYIERYRNNVMTSQYKRDVITAYSECK